MTHPANKRRDKNQKHIDRALRGQGEGPVQKATGSRKSPLGRRLEELRRRKSKKGE